MFENKNTLESIFFGDTGHRYLERSSYNNFHFARSPTEKKKEKIKFAENRGERGEKALDIELIWTVSNAKRNAVIKIDR